MSNATGGCLCGAIRYEVSGDPVVTGACHCRDCQYISGGAPAYGMLFLKDQVTLTQGDPQVYWTEAESGVRVGRYFCGTCGTPLFSENAAHPEWRPIKVGSLDDPSGFSVGANVWVSSAQSWHNVDLSLPSFERNPD